MLKLAQRMTDNFCSGVCASSAHEWNKLSGGINIGENVRVKTSQNVAEPGEPPGVVLSAATSVWLPIAPRCLFDFLDSKQLRSIIQDMAHIAKGKEIGNAVSLLRASVSIIYHLTHIYSLFGILSLVGHFMFGKIIESGTGYCSVRLVGPYRWSVPAMHLDMSGGDSTYVAFLPSGFAILPDGCKSQHFSPLPFPLAHPRGCNMLRLVVFICFNCFSFSSPLSSPKEYVRLQTFGRYYV
ncbi:hypothetical protein GW17_00040479 [Ensete ventricosum]|nr:hypothetical protein GW17_00040479 [Ensete ventricosum]